MKMVLTADKERVRTLLKDTITLLCRNGLNFKCKFSIEALIGVTLDDDDIFLISINELIRTELGIAQEAEAEAKKARSSAEEESDSDTGSPTKKHRRRKRKRNRSTDVKQEPDDHTDSDDNNDDRPEIKQIKTQPSEENSDESESRTDRQDESNQSMVEASFQDEDSEDLVFIKQEMDAWSENMSTEQPNFTFNQSAENQGNTQMANMWQHNRSFPGAVRSSTVTSASSSMMDDPSMSQSNQVGYSSDRPAYTYQCSICTRKCRSKFDLVRHENMHKNIFPYHCPYCNKGYMSTTSRNCHVISVHVGRKYECRQCYQRCVSKETLLEHTNAKHAQS